jgi:hypothetical protein
MKTKHVILTIVFGIILLGGCIGTGNRLPGTSVNPGSGSGTTAAFAGLSVCLNECPAMAESIRFLCYQRCYSEDAKAARNADKCDPLIQQYSLNLSYQVCLEDVGTVLHSPAPCDKIGDEMMRIVCVSQIAEFTKDASICDSVTHSNPAFAQSYQTDCRRQVANAMAG